MQNQNVPQSAKASFSGNRRGYGQTIIEDEGAYNAAIQRRIRENARKGKVSRWLAEDPSRAELLTQVQELGYDKPYGFFGKMAESIQEWGTLTQGQEAACRKIIAENAAKKAQWAEERKVAGAQSKHVGEIGERRNFVLTLKANPGFNTEFGYMVVHIMEDAEGNQIIYKGKPLERIEAEGGFSWTEASGPQRIVEVAKGESVSLKATVKAHEERDGVAQTIINRPKVS